MQSLRTYYSAVTSIVPCYIPCEQTNERLIDGLSGGKEVHENAIHSSQQIGGYAQPFSKHNSHYKIVLSSQEHLPSIHEEPP